MHKVHAQVNLVTSELKIVLIVIGFHTLEYLLVDYNSTTTIPTCSNRPQTIYFGFSCKGTMLLVGNYLVKYIAITKIWIDKA